MKTLINKTFCGLKEISRGMFTILKHGFRKPITQEYPEQRPELSSRFRGRLALLSKPDGTDVCIGCMSCTRVCPCGDLIQIKTEKSEETKKISVKEFTVDIGRCIFCGNCTDVCPVGAIVSSQDFELADSSREALVLDKRALTLSPQESERLKLIKDESR